jgi:predicted transcriptional regulator
MSDAGLAADDPPPVRRSGEWMVIWDDRILEYINAKGHGAPSQLAESGYVPVSRQHVTRRLNTLVEHGLLEPLGNGVHVMTERGRQYLAGEVSTVQT